MKEILKEKNLFVLRFDLGEEILETLGSFCEKEGVYSGKITAIGAISELVVSFYDLPNKQYVDRAFSKPLEIASFSGNISKKDGELVIHAHGVFSDEKGLCVGGHVKKMIVSATCELIIEVFEGKIARESNQDIGLNLMN